MKVDCHFHSNFSADSSAEPEEMIRSALERHLDMICFTDHVDLDFPQQIITFDTARYTEFLDAMAEKYRGHLEIRKGVEVGAQPHLAARNNAFVNSAPFDFVIASTHLINGLRPNSRCFSEYQERYPTVQEGTAAYLEDTFKNIQTHDNFDVYGHLDFLSVYTYRENFAYETHRELMDEILKLLIAKGKGIEINTSSLSSGFETSPCRAVLQRYRTLGGQIITLGSDAHNPKRIGIGIEQAQEILRECGFRYFTVFRSRVPEFHPL